jgi:hypothetical protein
MAIIARGLGLTAVVGLRDFYHARARAIRSSSMRAR